MRSIDCYDFEGYRTQNLWGYAHGFIGVMKLILGVWLIMIIELWDFGVMWLRLYRIRVLWDYWGYRLYGFCDIWLYFITS